MADRKNAAPAENTGKSKSIQMPSATPLGQKLNFFASEAYKLLRTNLNFSLPADAPCKIFGVTSSLRSEGKSTTSANLAYSIALTGQRVLLIDADMRLPSVAKMMQISNAPGLSNILAGMCSLKDAIVPSGMEKSLSVIPAGDIPPNPSELLGSANMASLLERLSTSFDYVIFDLPPITAVSDALVLGKLLQGMIVVVRKDYCSRQALNEAMRQIEFLNIKVLGFVMTRAENPDRAYRYRYGKYGRYGKYRRYGGYKSGYGYGHGYGYGYGYGYGAKKTQEAAKTENAVKAAQPDIQKDG